MRSSLLLALTAVLVVAAPASAQENFLEYTTWVEPEEFTFDPTKFQRDGNGELVRDESGAFVHEPQYVTLHVEATMDCTVPPDGEQIQFIATGPKISVQEGNETRYQLKLEPDTVNLTWQQEDLGAEWTASGSFDIQVISQAKPQATIEEEYAWFAEQVDIPQACPQDEQVRNVSPHTVIIPGSQPAAEGEGPGDDVDTPAPGALALIGAIGLAVALRRRQ